MAFYRDDEDEDQQAAPDHAGGVTTSQQSSVIDGSNSTPSSGNGSAPAGSTAGSGTPAPDKPDNFVGIKQYIDANKPQAAKLGDQTAGVINNSADQARQSVGALNQAANTAIKPTQSLGADILSKLNSTPENLSSDEKNTIKNTESAKYTGPAAATDLGDAYTNAATANQTAQNNITNAGTEQGRMNLISQINSAPRTQGMNVFDNTLLQAGGGRDKVQSAAAANSDIPGSLDAATAAINSQIGRADDPTTPDVDESSGAIGQTAKAQQDAYSNVQNALNNWTSGFTPKVGAAQQALTDQQNAVTKDISDNPLNLSPDTMRLLGLTPGEQVYDTNFNNYLNPASPSDINAANVATPEDYARYAALADLAGDQSNFLNPANASQAGTAPTYSANSAQLQKDISAKAQAYQTAYNTQKGGVLDRAFLNTLPNFGGNAGVLTADAANTLAAATPQELENHWIPYYTQLANTNTGPGGVGAYSDLVNGIQKSLDQWKQNQHLNNVVSTDMAGVPKPSGAHALN